MSVARAALLVIAGTSLAVSLHLAGVQGAVVAQSASAEKSGSDTASAAAGAELGATATVDPPLDDPRAISAEESRTLRRRMGDSFNAVETLPGTVPVFSGVPYLLVRGAPPAASSLYYDGVPVPWMFHLALGPAITHQALMGELTLHHGVAPARYGRRTGAVFSAAGPPAEPERGEAEFGLRLLDSEALGITKTQPAVSAHGRLGYPQLMLDLVDSDAALSYWDYQLRVQDQLAGGTELTVAVFGALDRIGDRDAPQDDIELQFHRALLRLRHAAPDFEIGSSVYLGYERGVLGQEISARSGRIGPSLWIEHSPSPGTRLRVGADLEAKLADIERTPPGDMVVLPDPRVPGGFVPDLGGGLDFQTGPEDLLALAPLTDIEGRNAGGIYAELGLLKNGPVEIETGVRGDVWISDGQEEHSADARLLVRWHALPQLALHAGLGRSHQAAVSPVPIPGLSDLELDHGLQSAVQSEAGVQLALPQELSLSLTGFYHRFTNLVFMELVIDCEGNSDPQDRLPLAPGQTRGVPLCEQPSVPRGDGQAYGVELLLKRDLLEKLTGWATYTLGFADALADDGTEFTPQFDVRHLLNLVLSVDWGGGFESGLSLHYRTGKPAVNTIFDLAQRRYEHVRSRLPSFFRADVHLGYRWRVPFGRIGVTLQWLNLTFSREATKRDCRLEFADDRTGEPDDRLPVVCEVDYQPAIVLPNAGVKAEF
jgi:hypothetical protein